MEEVHDVQRLRELQALPLDRKILISQTRIIEWYTKNNGNVYVSFSGGKDSTVLLHLVRQCFPDVKAVFINTGLEYPEVQRFVSTFDNVEIIRPKMSFQDVIKKYGYPVISKEVSRKVYEARSADRTGYGMENSYAYKQLMGTYVSKNGKTNSVMCTKYKYLLDSDFGISHMCCDIMKKRPSHAYSKQTGCLPYIATMACESMLRQKAWVAQGCNAFTGKNPSSKPMSFWTEQDVLQYLLEYDLPYCSLYGDIVQGEDGKLTTTGHDRTGCVFCGFGCHLEKGENRFKRLKRTHPVQYRYCINGGEYVDGVWQPSKEGLGMSHVLDFIGVDYE